MSLRFQYSVTFKKQYRKLPERIRRQCDARLVLFAGNRYDPRLRTHPLKGTYSGYWSFNVNGDVRVLFIDRGDELVILAFVGTHSELYG